MRGRRGVVAAAALAALLVLPGCGTSGGPGYYAQAVGGHLDLLQRRARWPTGWPTRPRRRRCANACC